MKPSRGQIIVTEKASPFLRYPIVTVRQTDEGGVMIGDSEEADGASLTIDHLDLLRHGRSSHQDVPSAGDLNVVRTWTAFRVMTPDGCPVYEQSQSYPGAFVAMAHSGVTLAPQHALRSGAGDCYRDDPGVKLRSSEPGGSMFRRAPDRAQGSGYFHFRRNSGHARRRGTASLPHCWQRGSVPAARRPSRAHREDPIA